VIDAPRVRREARNERNGPRREGESSVDCGIRSCMQRWSVSFGLDSPHGQEAAAAHGWDTYPNTFEGPLGVGGSCLSQQVGERGFCAFPRRDGD
jgi:hypothetical protein